MTFRHGLLIGLIAVVVACARTGGGGQARPRGGGTFAEGRARSHVAAARRAEAEGDHLCASRFYEAAMAEGGDAREILPLLLAAQIRSNRLLAARKTALRLAEIDPGKEGLDELIALLTSMERSASVEENER
jgi:hypothetical protein